MFFPSIRKDRRMVATPAQPGTRAHATTWRRWTVLSILCFLVGLGVFFVWRWDRDRAQRHESLRIAEHGRFSEAEPLLLQVAQRHSDDAEVAKRLALGYLGA